MPAAAAAAPAGAAEAQIQLFFTVAPLGQPLKNVSVRAAYSDSAADVVRGAAAEALGGSEGGEGGEGGGAGANRRLVAFWHGAQIDLGPGAEKKTVEQIGWHTGFGVKVYELPARAEGEGEGKGEGEGEGDGEDGGADWARVSAAVDFFPPVERVQSGAAAGGGLVLREVGGDAAIKLVQESARARMAARAKEGA